MVQVLEFSKKSQKESTRFKRGLLPVRTFVTAALLVVLVLAMACETNTSAPSDAEDFSTVIGLITKVESLSLTELAALEIRDDAGKVWVFDGGGKRFSRFTPSHLNEHQVLGLKVKIHYFEEEGVLVIEGITD